MMKLDMLSKDERRELYHELSKEFARIKDPIPGLREAKLKAAGAVLSFVADFPTPQQRQILDFARDIVMRTTKNFGKDSAYEAPQIKPNRRTKTITHGKG